MTNVACFISGRLTCYETDLVRLLTQLSFDLNIKIHLFCSINGIRDEYHIAAEETLSPWLRQIEYEIFKVPDTFVQNTHNETLLQIVDDKKVPYTVLSCFYNDLKSFQMIEEYQVKHNIIFDVCCKLRADISFSAINSNIFINLEKNTLYSCIPPCTIYLHGNASSNMCISDAFVFGHLNVMKKYCDTYNFIINTNNSRNGFYRINYEPCVTESFLNETFDVFTSDVFERLNNAYKNNIYNVKYFNCPYSINKRRRIRDTVQEFMRAPIQL